MDLMHPHYATDLHERLEGWGQDRTIQAVDQAIQNSVENYREQEGHFPTLSNDYDWDYVQYGAVASLDIDHDLVGL